MRAAHSLLLGLARYDNVTVTAISPPQLALPEALVAEFEISGNRLEASTDLTSLADADVVYVAGFPPRTGGQEWSDEARSPFCITLGVARALRRDAAILCPLPRIDEIDRRVDSLPQARYFWQSELGLRVRMAVLAGLLESSQHR
jgi:aspartate carbamoyltransferase catalytic subunit